MKTKLHSLIGINPEQFDLHPAFFQHPSELHGIGHTYRVMCHTMIIGKCNNLFDEARLAFFSAFIHDMAREHDGLCQDHGARAADSKTVKFLPLFKQNGLKESEEEIIRTAVSYHSKDKELDVSHPHYIVTAILKDADALDRVRLGRNNITLSRLRFESSKSLTDYGWKLFQASLKQTIKSFAEQLSIAEQIYAPFEK